jgi:hypothetical protein
MNPISILFYYGQHKIAQNNATSLKIIISLMIIFNLIEIKAQTAPPKHDWKAVTWEDEDIEGYENVTQAKSADEWWYAHENFYDLNGKHIGYIAGGYISNKFLYNHTSAINKVKSNFNEGIESPTNPMNLNITNFPLRPYFTGDCEDFQPGVVNNNNYELNTQYRGMLARLDLNGKMLWCKTPCISGDGIQGICTDGEDIYVIGRHNGIRRVMDDATPTNKPFIPYNSPTQSNTNPVYLGTNGTSSPYAGSQINYVTANAQGNPYYYGAEGAGKMYVAKFDKDGNLDWERLIGPVDLANTTLNTVLSNHISVGSSIIKHSNGFLYAVGTGDSGSGGQFFVAKLSTSGVLINKVILTPGTTIYNGIGGTNTLGEAKSICEIGSGNLVVGGLTYFNTTNRNYLGSLYAIDANLNVLPQPTAWQNAMPFLIYPGTFPAPSGTRQNSKISDVKYSSGKIILGVINECADCNSTAADTRGNGEVWRLNTNGTMVSGNNPVSLGPVNAYDLREGVTPTSDGGFGVISARRNLTGNAPMGGFALGAFNSLCYNYWTSLNNGGWGTLDTDPLIVKFDANGNKLWEWSEDIDPARTQVPRHFASDFKRRECMYKITEAFDGGLVASGNSSTGNDDNYMVKLAGECSRSQTYDFGILPQILMPWTGSNGPVTIINYPMTFAAKLVIPNGVTIVFTGANTIIKFADGHQIGHPCGIEVEPGGHLIVQNGAQLTSIDNAVCPGAMWDGIAVRGNGNLRGMVDLNNATISNARIGIITGYHERIPSGNTGGMVHAINSSFINNERDVEMYGGTTPLTSQSYFSNCHFLINNELNNRLDPVQRVYLENMRNVAFNGSEFKYNAGAAYDYKNRGYGIHSNNSTFAVRDLNPNSTSPTRSLFQDLTMAVEACNAGQNLGSVSVDHAIFNCYNNTSYTGAGQTDIGGVNLFNVPSAQITRNDFNLNLSLNWGISVNGCKNYKIENNNFTGQNQTNCAGIFASNSGSGDHRIYRNNFNNLYVGIIPQNNNGNMLDEKDGLIMNCNTFTGNEFDIAMVSEDQVVIPTVRKHQGFSVSGSSKDFVRNLYSANCINLNYNPNNPNNIPNNQWYIEYTQPSVQMAGTTYQIVHETLANQYANYWTIPNCADQLVNASAGNTPLYPNDCPVNSSPILVNNNPTKGNLMEALSISSAKVNSLQSNYNNALDGGHSQNILSQIADQNVDEATVRAHLNFHYGYLSDAVLTAYFNRNTVPFNYILEVHDANSPVSSAVWLLLQSKGYNEEQLNQLTTQQNQNAYSIRQLDEFELSSEKAELQSIYAHKMNCVLLEQEENVADTLLTMVNSNIGNLPDIEFLKISALAFGGNYGGAFDYIDSQSNNTSLSESLLLEKTLLELDTAVSGLGKIKYNAGLYNTISTYASNKSMAGHYKAQAVMRTVYGNKYDLKYKYPSQQAFSRATNTQSNNTSVTSVADASITRRTEENKASLNSNKSQNNNFVSNPPNTFTKAFEAQFENSFNMFPNPANNTLNFIINSKINDKCELFIVDLLGKTIYSDKKEVNKPFTIDVKTFETGIYFVNINQNGLKFETKKLTIIK